MTLPANRDQHSANKLRELVRQQAEGITRNYRELNWHKIKIDKVTHEVPYERNGGSKVGVQQRGSQRRQ